MRPLHAIVVRRVLPLLGVAWSAACAVGGGPADGLDEVEARPDAWTVGTAEHVGLWYHGMAYAAGPADAEPDDGVLPSFRPDYVETIVQRKRREGVYPTVLDRRAAEFGDFFAGDDAYDALQFLPLYFRDAEALFSSIELWADTGGDPRRAGSQEAARVVAFLSNLFPRAAQRRVIVEWADVLRAERDTFYAAYWTERAPALERTASAVQREWDALAPALSAYLDYMQLEGGDLLLVPALGPEGRTVIGGPIPARVAVLVPEEASPDDAVWSFVHELLYPLVDEVIRDYVAPVRIREIGFERLATRAAVRGGALLLEEAAPASADTYRRFFLRWASGGEAAEDDGADDDPFERAFPLPPELERGLRDAVGRALAGI